MRKLISINILICIFIIYFIPISYSTSDSIYTWSENLQTTSTSSLLSNNQETISLESESAILIEQHSGKILFEKNCHEKLRPASVTKIMSILLIMEALDEGKISLDDKVPCSKNAADMGGSQIWLDTREQLTINDMLKAICVASANDCTVAMAEYLAGSEEAFVKKMNEKAKKLGMNDTNFINCHGLDTDNHITSSYDIALMSKELLNKYPNITNYTSIYMDTLRDGKSELVNTNKLIRNYKGATGLKTGSTGLALYNLSASATRDNLSLIAVIMKAPTTSTRFSEAQKLLDYGFNNYTYISFANKNDFIKNVNVTKGTSKSLEAIFEENSGTLISKNQKDNVEQIITIPDYIEAPIEKNQIIGKVEYKINDEILGSTNIISNNTIKKLTLSNMTEKLFFTWFKILR